MRMLWATVTVCGFALSGCALAADGGDTASGTSDESAASDESTPVASTTQALTAPWVNGPYTWNQGQNVLALQPVASHFCVLTRMSGHFQGLGEAVRLYNDGAFWYLTGSSHQDGVGAEAYCFPKDGVLSSNGSFYSTGEFEDYALGRMGCNQSRGIDAMPGAFPTVLSGLSGHMEGGAEWAAIQQSAGAHVGSKVVTSTCTDSFLVSEAYSFTIGSVWKSTLATFMRPDGSTGNVTNVPQITTSGSAGFAILAPVETSVCYFSGIRGGFRGGGEWVQIRPERIGSMSYWVLRTGKGSASSYVEASARCFARDQR